MQQTLVSKSEFATLINVSAGRVSQFIASGQISQAAIVGTGQRAKIDLERAKADLRMTLDVSQRLGNGIDTNLNPGPAESPVAGAGAVAEHQSGPATLPQPILPSGIDYDIKQQKLEQLRRANRNGAVADAQNSGRLMETDQGRAEMARIAASMLLVFEGGLTDFASAIASEFKLPHRDVLHLLRSEFRKVREKAKRQAKAEAVEFPETVETVLEADDIETIN